MISGDFARRASVRGGAFVGAAAVTGLLLALQVGMLRGAVPATLYLVAEFAPFALIDALLVPRPRTSRGRLARILLAFALLFALGAARQWRAFLSVPPDLQLEIAVETLLRNVAFLGAYLLIEALLGSAIRRRVPA